MNFTVNKLEVLSLTWTLSHSITVWTHLTLFAPIYLQHRESKKCIHKKTVILQVNNSVEPKEITIHYKIKPNLLNQNKLICKALKMTPKEGIL